MLSLVDLFYGYSIRCTGYPDFMSKPMCNYGCLISWCDMDQKTMKNLKGVALPSVLMSYDNVVWKNQR